MMMMVDYVMMIVLWQHSVFYLCFLSSTNYYMSFIIIYYSIDMFYTEEVIEWRKKSYVFFCPNIY